MYKPPPKFLQSISMRDLIRGASAVVEGPHDRGEAVLITKRGRPVAMMFPVLSNAVQDDTIDVSPPENLPDGVARRVLECMEERGPRRPTRS